MIFGNCKHYADCPDNATCHNPVYGQLVDRLCFLDRDTNNEPELYFNDDLGIVPVPSVEVGG